MQSWLAIARQRFHAACLSGPISITNGIPSIADVANVHSRAISVGLIDRIGTSNIHANKPSGQSAGAMFEAVCREFIHDSLAQLTHMRPGQFQVERG